MRLVPKTNQSYTFFGDCNHLSALLVEQGCISHPIYQHEYSRFLCREGGGCYIILYRNGTVLLQGQNIEAGRAMLLRAFDPIGLSEEYEQELAECVKKHTQNDDLC